jgi:ribonuclease VapC
MVIDTSALIALLLGEPSSEKLLEAIDAAPSRKVSAATVIEASLVLLGRYGEAGDAQLDKLLQVIRAEVVPVDVAQSTAARDGASRFGRGRHAAALDFGDCFSYALAVSSGEPLLFTGDDFAQTDVEAVKW